MALRDVVFSKNDCSKCGGSASALWVHIGQPASLANVTFTANLPSGHAIDCQDDSGKDKFYKGGHYAQLTFNGKQCPSPPLVRQGALIAPGHTQLF